MPIHRYIVVSTFEAMKPRTFRKMKQESGHRERIGVSVPRLGRWCFNTRTHSMSQIVSDEQEMAKLAAKLKSRNIWCDHHQID